MSDATGDTQVMTDLYRSEYRLRLLESLTLDLMYAKRRVVQRAKGPITGVAPGMNYK